MARHSGNLECKVYVGDLPRDASEKEVERVFSSYGRLRNVWVARNPPGFAFLEYEDPRDAEDAVKNLDGSTICGGKIRVEHSTGKSRPKPWLRNQYGGDRGRGDYYGNSRRPPARRSYDSREKCYKCGGYGHAGSECNSRSRSNFGRRTTRSRSRSRSRGRKSYSRSPSRSRSREDRSRGRSRSKSRSAEKRPVAQPAAPSRSRSRSRRRRDRSGSSDESA